MQLKRWNIRKNATRNEWQQFFSTSQGRSTSTSIDEPGRDLPTVILSKSTESKKRASRWAAGSLPEPSAPQPCHEAHPVDAPILNESPSLGTAKKADIHHPFLNLGNALGGLESVPQHTDHLFRSMSATLDLHANSSQAFFDAVGGPAQIVDVNPTPQFQYLFPDGSSFDRTVFLPLGIPTENNMTFFSMLQGTEFNRELPSAQLEHNLRSKGMVLDRVAGGATFGGFASKVVAGMLSPTDQCTIRQTPNLQHFLHKLGAQVPGQSSALITDDQAFETKFARLLIFSMLNGFAGLDDVPMENILRFLSRIAVNKLLIDILKQCPHCVCRTLADNIFRAAIEAADTRVVNLLLSYKLVNVNETVCHHKMNKYTPVERAAMLRSPKLMKSLIDAGADVNKSYRYAISQRETTGGSLGALISGIEVHLRVDKGSTMPPQSFEAFDLLIAAGARVHPNMMIMDQDRRTVEFDFLVSQNISPDDHREFFVPKRDSTTPLGTFWDVATHFDDHRATKSAEKVISLCHQTNCNSCLTDGIGLLRASIVKVAEAGKVELVRFLLDKADLSHELPQILIAAIMSRSHVLIDFILSLGPDIDPPATIDQGSRSSVPKTPIAEAVRYGNDDLIRKFEAEGCLDHLSEGRRYEALLVAAAEAGNTDYVNKLLARSVTSRQACRPTANAVTLSISGHHRDITQMLLEAGPALDGHQYFPYGPRNPVIEALQQGDEETVRDLIASGGSRPEFFDSIRDLTQADVSVIFDLVLEYPGFDFRNWHIQNKFLSGCLETCTPDFFKEIIQTSDIKDFSLNICLESAVRLGHGDLIGFLLDMGANPFDEQVLQAAIPDRPEMLGLLFHQERLRQTMPKCIGPSILEPVMGNGAGNATALDELLRTNALNFTRLEVLCDRRRHPGRPLDYYDSIRFTPLGLAIDGLPWSFDTNIVAMKKFLEAGADPNGISKSNDRWTRGSPLMTALMVAIEKGREDAVTMLLDHGADANARPRLRTTRTALQFAAEIGSADMVRLLLGRGADVNSPASPRGGATALQFAAMSGNCNMAAELLDHGAQLDALPSRIDGMWPFEGAAANGRLDMIRYLWELNVRAVAGGTFPGGFSERHCLRAMNFARENGHMGCRDLISELSGASVDRLETDEYGAPWIAY